MSAPPFLDTNVLLYLLSSDAAKADRAEALLAAGATVSVQVLNEFANVALRKLDMTWPETLEALTAIRRTCEVESLTLETHQLATELAQRYRLSFYDSVIVAAALLAECRVLYSEDMHDGLRVDKALTIRNPFRPRPGLQSGGSPQ
jgi:predicted nucleic acid-binding protein